MRKTIIWLGITLVGLFALNYWLLEMNYLSHSYFLVASIAWGVLIVIAIWRYVGKFQQNQRQQAWLRERSLEDSYRLFVTNFQGVAYQAELDPFKPVMLGGQVEQLCGYTIRDLMSGRVRILDLVAPQDLPELLDNLRQIDQSPNPTVYMQFRIYHKDGSTRWVEASASQVFAEGKVLVQGAIHDVSSRYAAEQAVRGSEQMLRQITNAMQDIVVLTDENAIIRYITPSVYRVAGVLPETIIGQSAYSILDQSQSRRFQELSAAARPENSSAQTEFNYLHPDGRSLMMEVSINFLFDSEDHDRGAVAGIRDVTDRRRAEQAVRESEQMLRQITNAMQDVVAFADSDGIIRYVTPSLKQMLGYEAEQIMGHSFLDFVHPEDHILVQQAVAQALRRKASYRLEYRYRHAQGAVVWIETTVDFVYDEQGRFIGSVVGGRDVTARHEAEEALREREFRLSQITNTMQDVVMLLDIGGTIQYITPSVEAIFGYHQDELIGKPGWLLAKLEDYAELEQEGFVALRGRRSYKLEYQGTHKAGHHVWVESIINFVWDWDKPTGVVVGIRDITERKQQEAYTEYMAFHDELTKLPNRRSLRQQAEGAIEEAKLSGQPLSLLYLDLDNFKIVNDTLGHDIGDELLVEIAQILSRQVRPSDTLARLGGDEFACILTNTHHEQSKQLAMQMAQAIQGTFALAQQNISLGVSIGIASYPEDGDNFVDLLKVADIAMYQAKESGSRVVAYDANKSPYTEERLRLEAHLRDAVAQESFDLQYQPIWHLGQNRLEGAEALLYWNDQNRIVLASQFILLAEEIRLIEQIDKIALYKGLRQLRSWQARGLNQCLSINLSTQSLARRENLGELIQILGDSSADPRGLTLEITESALLRNPEEAREVLGELRALGVRIAIDDFGSGYASLAYLRQLPLDRIKIDRSFISQLGFDARDEKLVRAAIDLAHSLDAEVLAEGVETKEQLLWLAEQDCDLVQGYLIGPPEPISKWQPNKAISESLNRMLRKSSIPSEI